MNLPLSDRERMIALLERYGEIPHRQAVIEEEPEHYERHEPLWKPWEAEDDSTR